MALPRQFRFDPKGSVYKALERPAQAKQFVRLLLENEVPELEPRVLVGESLNSISKMVLDSYAVFCDPGFDPPREASKKDWTWSAFLPPVDEWPIFRESLAAGISPQVISSQPAIGLKDGSAGAPTASRRSQATVGLSTLIGRSARERAIAAGQDPDRPGPTRPHSAHGVSDGVGRVPPVGELQTGSRPPSGRNTPQKEEWLAWMTDWCLRYCDENPGFTKTKSAEQIAKEFRDYVSGGPNSDYGLTMRHLRYLDGFDPDDASAEIPSVDQVWVEDRLRKRARSSVVIRALVKEIRTVGAG